MYASAWNVCYCNFDRASLDIVFMLLKEYYPDLGIHPWIGCIGMVASRVSLQAIWANTSLPLTSWCILIWTGRGLEAGRPFAAEVACGQVTVSYLAYPRVALMLDYTLASGKTIDVYPFAGRFLSNWRWLTETTWSWAISSGVPLREVSQGGSRHHQPIH